MNCILLALMHTWQVHVCIYTHTYIQYIHCTADDLRGGGGTEWMLGSAECDKSSLTNVWEMSTKSEMHLSFKTSYSFRNYFVRPTEQMRVFWSQQWTVWVQRVLWKVLELPWVLFYSLAHPCCAKIGFSYSKPLADMNKMYQIHLCTYKDLCSLTDKRALAQNSNCDLTHIHSPPEKKGKGIITCTTYKYIQVCKHQVLLKKLATDTDKHKKL